MNTRHTNKKVRTRNDIEDDEFLHKTNSKLPSSSTFSPEMPISQTFRPNFVEPEQQLIESMPLSPPRRHIDIDSANLLLSLGFPQKELSYEQKILNRVKSREVKKQLESKKRKSGPIPEKEGKKKSYLNGVSVFDISFNQLFVQTKMMDDPPISLDSLNRDFFRQLKNQGNYSQIPPPCEDLPKRFQDTRDQPLITKKPVRNEPIYEPIDEDYQPQFSGFDQDFDQDTSLVRDIVVGKPKEKKPKLPKIPKEHRKEHKERRMEPFQRKHPLIAPLPPKSPLDGTEEKKDNEEEEQHGEQPVGENTEIKKEGKNLEIILPQDKYPRTLPGTMHIQVACWIYSHKRMKERVSKTRAAKRQEKAQKLLSRNNQMQLSPKNPNFNQNDSQNGDYISTRPPGKTLQPHNYQSYQRPQYQQPPPQTMHRQMGHMQQMQPQHPQNQFIPRGAYLVQTQQPTMQYGPPQNWVTSGISPPLPYSMIQQIPYQPPQQQRVSYGYQNPPVGYQMVRQPYGAINAINPYSIVGNMMRK